MAKRLRVFLIFTPKYLGYRLRVDNVAFSYASPYALSQLKAARRQSGERARSGAESSNTAD